jgi:hypothetical protein
MSAICRSSWPSMSAISTTGAHIVPSDNAHPARPRHLRLIKALKLERSSQSQCLEASIMFISTPRDSPDQIVAPYSPPPPSSYPADRGACGVAIARAVRCVPVSNDAAWRPFPLLRPRCTGYKSCLSRRSHYRSRRGEYAHGGWARWTRAYRCSGPEVSSVQLIRSNAVDVAVWTIG